MKYFQIGSLSIPSIWLAAAIALLVASLIYRVIAGKKVDEWYWNGFFLYVLVWKLSYILFHFTLFLDTPLSLIYFTGGMKGHLLAVVILSLYFLFIAVKKRPSITEEATTLVLLYFICYELLITLLEKDRIEAIFHLVLLICYVLFLKRNRGYLSSQLFIVLMLLELLILSFFGTIFSIDRLTFIWLGLTALMLSKKVDREDQNFE